MIITNKYAKKLIKAGAARLAGSITHNDAGEAYVIIDRLDLCRVDHVRLPGADRTPN